MQLAKVDGLTVIADASKADHELVASFGADIVVRRGDDVETLLGSVPYIRRPLYSSKDKGFIPHSVFRTQITLVSRSRSSSASLRPSRCW